MTVRLRVRHSLLAGLLLLGGVGGAGCVDEKSGTDLDPTGNPKILQVFVLDPDDSDDPGGSGLTITYGVHQDVNKCTFDKTCAEGLCCAGQTGCNAATELAGHCVDATTFKQPIASAAVV